VNRRGDSAPDRVGAAGADSTRTVIVWDPLVRVLHWSLVVAVGLGWATTFRLGGWHRAVGWTALAIVVVRVAWGLVGPRRARFGSFVRGPLVTARHARRVLAGDEPRHVGHNPLGGWMIVALLVVVAGLAFTGWLYNTERFWGDQTVEQLHVWLAWAIVALAAVHVAGVFAASFRHRENLVAAMLDGKKRAPRDDDIE
jgi:cytochrome b